MALQESAEAYLVSLFEEFVLSFPFRLKLFGMLTCHFLSSVPTWLLFTLNELLFNPRIFNLLDDYVENDHKASLRWLERGEDRQSFRFFYEESLLFIAFGSCIHVATLHFLKTSFNDRCPPVKLDEIKAKLSNLSHQKTIQMIPDDDGFSDNTIHLRPYHYEPSAPQPIPADTQSRGRRVLTWVTNREYHMMLSQIILYFFSFLCRRVSVLLPLSLFIALRRAPSWKGNDGQKIIFALSISNG